MSEPPRTRAPAVSLLLTTMVLIGACTPGLGTIQDRPGERAITTAGPWTSMIYAARTDEGVILVDLGWDPSGASLERVLSELGADPGDVVAVFLTHSHRDHIAGWRHVRHAPFHMAEAEVSHFLGEEVHQGTVPRIASVVPADLPEPGELDIRPFAGDTAFVFGSDTLRAFPVPGHTPGSAAYLLRDVVFAGDALTYNRGFGFRPARRIYSDDLDQAERELDALWRRVEPYEPRHVCTAHGACAEFAALMEEWDREEDTEAAGPD